VTGLSKPDPILALLDASRTPEQRARDAVGAMTAGARFAMNGQALAALGVAELWASGDWSAAEEALGVDLDDLWAAVPDKFTDALRERGWIDRTSPRYCFYLLVGYVLGVSTVKAIDGLLTHGEFIQALAEGVRNGEEPLHHSLPWPSETNALLPAARTVRTPPGGPGVPSTGFNEADDETRQQMAEQATAVWRKACDLASESERVRRRIGAGGLPELAPSSTHVRRAAKDLGIKVGKAATKPTIDAEAKKRAFRSVVGWFIRDGRLKTLAELLEIANEELAAAQRERDGLS